LYFFHANSFKRITAKVTKERSGKEKRVGLSFQRRCKQALNLCMTVAISLDEINAFAQQFWTQANNTKVFLFYGEMGAGKTTLIEALCAAKGVNERMGSPTFSIINQYAYTEDSQEKLIYHIDLYRLKDEEEIIQAGVEDCVYSGNICMIEWPQKAPNLFDNTAAKIFLEPIDATHRNVKMRLPGGSMAEQL
jgi:tRNA threonylcarbamoyladenosine biosynthesis protein TsaE